MKWNRFADTAKKAIEGRGGTEGLKRDAEQLREIARGQGSAKDKARRAADALKHSPKQKGPEQKGPDDR